MSNTRNKLIARMAGEVLVKKFTGTEVAIDNDGLNSDVAVRIKNTLTEAGCKVTDVKDRVLLLNDVHYGNRHLFTIPADFDYGGYIQIREVEEPEIKVPSRLFMALMKRL